MNESSQAKFKKTLKNFIRNKDKDKVSIKFDDKETKLNERTLNYNSLVKDVTKYQEKVKVNREADILDFTGNTQKISTSAKSIMNNTKELNSLEKSIKDMLVKNKYDTDDKILEQENQKLLSVNPDDLKRRYEELKKIKYLLFQREIDNKRKSKIKSKLAHKIKKKQREREENTILSQLQEVDPEGVKKYLDKKKLNRIKERIELKHSTNSKFSKTVKRYNLQNNEGVKDAIKENFKLRDELLKKIKSADEVESESEENDDDDGDIEEGDEIEGSEDNADENDNEEIEEDKLLINFNEDDQADKPVEEVQQTGVWGMKFMKNGDNLQSKLKEVLKEVDTDDEFYENEEDVKKNNKNEEVEEIKVEKKLGKLNARKKNMIEEKGEVSHTNKNNHQSKNKTITSEVKYKLTYRLSKNLMKKQSNISNKIE